MADCGCNDQSITECGKELVTLPLLSGCPADSEWFIVGNATGGFGTYKYARRTWGDIKECLESTIITRLFGIGILTINGTQLTDGIYLNSDLINDLVVFYNGINRFLIRTVEWDYVILNDNVVGDNVVGVQILIGANWTAEDVFLIFPNPKVEII